MTMTRARTVTTAMLLAIMLAAVGRGRRTSPGRMHGQLLERAMLVVVVVVVLVVLVLVLLLQALPHGMAV